jgi:hypothetical protein
VRVLVCIALAACGRIGFNPLAGGSGDAGVGGSDSGSGTITVRSVGVSWVTTPLAGATIVVADATGALQRSFVSSGVDTVAIEPGWMIAAIPAGPSEVYVVEDVQPGDVIEFGQGVADPRTPTGTMTVSVPGYLNSEAFTPCEAFTDKTTTITLDQYAGCASAFDLLVVNGAASQYAVVPVTFGTPATATLAAMPNVTFMVTNVPAMGSIGINEMAVFQGHSLGDNGSVAEAGPPSTFSYAIPGETSLGDARYVEVFTALTSGTFIVVDNADVTASTITIDMAQNQLPALTTAGFDLTTRTASVSFTGSGAYDGMLWELKGTPSPDWWIVAPVGHSVVLPELPSEMASLMFTHGSMFDLYATLFDGDIWSGYADVKAVPTWQLANEILPFFGADAHTVLASAIIVGVTVP